MPVKISLKRRKVDFCSRCLWSLARLNTTAESTWWSLAAHQMVARKWRERRKRLEFLISPPNIFLSDLAFFHQSLLLTGSRGSRQCHQLKIKPLAHELHSGRSHLKRSVLPPDYLFSPHVAHCLIYSTAGHPQASTSTDSTSRALRMFCLIASVLNMQAFYPVIIP